MKKALLTLSLLGVFLSGTLISSAKSGVAALAYNTSSLPTTIILNDNSDDEIRNYYSALNGLDVDQRQGENLLKNLKPILKNGQKYYSYDSGDNIWKMYEIADRDWDLSPASSTTYGTYNPETNTITGYSYGSGKNNPYIHALYINRNVDNETKAWGNHNQDRWGINREHVWPKSHGFENEGKGGARGDPMHLMAGNGYSNNIHGNNFYGYVDKTKTYTDCGSKYDNQWGNLLGKSKTLGGSASVFEPQDCDKGDIARAIFYMVARYNYLSGSDSDGIDCNNPNLKLVETAADSHGTNGYQSTKTDAGEMGVLSDLLEWHKIDPVDDFEIHRNNLLYNNYTNNRNPFIDFPEWVDCIWGEQSTVSFASPATDAINGKSPVGPESSESSSSSESTSTSTPTSSSSESSSTPSQSSSSSDTPAGGDDDKIFGLPKMTFFIIAGVGGGVLVILIIVLLIAVPSLRKKGRKVAKKQIKKQVRKNSSKKKK